MGEQDGEDPVFTKPASANSFFTSCIQEKHAMAYENILTEIKGKVAIITLNRPKALNALNNAMMVEVARALDEFEEDAGVGCIILTGSEKAFAAGADIKEIQSLTYIDLINNDPIQVWDRIARSRKPVIAAVAGFTLGGGCEIAMMCDFMIAADNAKFGQPEITLGVLPGAGGTQRLTRLIGKSKAMDMCLTGRMMGADEAEQSGLVSRVVPAEKLMDETLKAADKIASFSQPAVKLMKEAVNRALETPLSEGLIYERRIFSSLFGTADQIEGMDAFANKREPQFKNK